MQTAVDYAKHMAQYELWNKNQDGETSGGPSQRWGSGNAPNNATVEGGRLNYGRELDERRGEDGTRPGGSGSAERDQYDAGLGAGQIEPAVGSFEPLPHPQLADAARTLGDDAVSMESYQHFQGPGNGDGLAPAWGWFFSPNAALKASVKKPTKLDSWADWAALSSPTNRERIVIADLAGFDPAAGIPENAANLAKLKAAYAKWPATKVAAFLRGSVEASNTCNLFLGDALYIAGLAKMRTEEAKYFSAAEVFTGNPPFYEVAKGHVQPGDIAAFGGSHLEIVTSVSPGVGGRTFCSRGGYRPPMGKEKCTGRVVSDSSIRFMRVIRSGFQI